MSDHFGTLCIKRLKTQKNSKILEIMYNNEVYVCISWYSKTSWFPVKKCWCQQNSRLVSRDSYIFLDLLWVRYNCVKFHHCKSILHLHPWAAPKRPILKRVNTEIIQKTNSKHHILDKCRKTSSVEYIWLQAVLILS